MDVGNETRYINIGRTSRMNSRDPFYMQNHNGEMATMTIKNKSMLKQAIISLVALFFKLCS